MKKQVIDQIIHGMLHRARPLEIARARHLFSDGTLSEVMDLLKDYQNEDGGFGHGLEPDFLNPNSSAIQSWVAVNIIREHKVDQMHPVVQHLFTYLENTFDDTIMRWHAIPKNNKDYPHAPWWADEGPLDSFNPSSSLAGFIIRYGNPMTKIYFQAKKVCEEAMNYILNFDKPIERHTLRTLIEMLNDISDLYYTNTLFIKAKKEMILRLEEVIERDKSTWFTKYVNKPSSLIKNHPSIGSEVYFNLLLEEIDEALKHQNEEHLWDITWKWADNDHVKEASFAWQGIIALDYLILIKDLGIPLET
ncbi:MAG: hypothetical protein WC992_04735 [Acholeplasmataceae bacterium]|jgi:hypothetical protein|nr:hypothetical protein [Acholeplasmataceae bacterium]